jgi:hypothetical protein
VFCCLASARARHFPFWQQQRSEREHPSPTTTTTPPYNNPPPLYSSVCVLPFDLSPSPKWVLYGLTVEPPLSTRLDSNAP